MPEARLILTCGNDSAYSIYSFQFIKQYKRAMAGLVDMEFENSEKKVKKSSFDPALVKAMREGKITLDTEPGEKGGEIIFHMEGTKEELAEWTKDYSRKNRFIMRLGLLKSRVEYV